MMKVLVFALLLICLVAANVKPVFKGTNEEQFEQFKQVYGKNYKSSVEAQMRFKIFSDSLVNAKRMTEESNGVTQYGVTQFSDLTKEEFTHLYLMKRSPKLEIVAGKDLQFNYTNTEVKSFWDWRYAKTKTGWDGSCVSPVYNQGQCGSCWAFSATEQIESMYCLQGHSGGSARQLSMQQIVDCDTTCYGCDGGWTYLAYAYVISQGGIDSYASYPYTAQDGSCAYNPGNSAADINAWGYVGRGNEPAMLSYVQNTGPLSICVDASSWQYYNGGVVVTCGQAIDHCVQITGWSANVQGRQAWIVRNSWGTSWGYSGYLYVAYGSNTCAIADVPTTVNTV